MKYLNGTIPQQTELQKQLIEIAQRVLEVATNDSRHLADASLISGFIANDLKKVASDTMDKHNEICKPLLNPAIS